MDFLLFFRAYNVLVSGLRYLWPSICNNSSCSDNEIESLKIDLKNSLLHNYRLLCSSVYKNDPLIYKDQFKASIINISRYLADDLDIDLSSRLDAWKLANFLFDFLQLFFQSK